MNRKPIAAGQFYAAGQFELDKQIASCFTGKRGPGDMPVSKRKGKVIAIIAPHAGYEYSGQCAAWAYKEIAEAEFADVYIILAANHTGEKTSLIMDNFETPYGIVRVSQEFAKILLAKGSIPGETGTHMAEHAIEVQLPFLQYVNKDFINELKILPIVVGDDCNISKLSLDIKESMIEYGKKVCIIASSDFTHYGRSYHYLPFTSDVEKNLYALDSKAIELIKHMDDLGFLKHVDETGATICGAMAIALLMRCIKPKKAELLQYYTSGDLAKDYRNSVGYAAMVFK